MILIYSIFMIIQFTPVANSSEEYAQVTIPMAVISHDDWIKYKDKVGQYVHSSLQQIIRV